MMYSKKHLYAAHRSRFGRLVQTEIISCNSNPLIKLDGTCAHYNIAVWHDLGGSEEHGPWFARCMDCKVCGPVRKTESGAVNALAKGLKK